MSLESELKEAMGYNELVKQCELCSFSKISDDPDDDYRDVRICTFNIIRYLKVEKKAHCNKFKSVGQ